MAANVGSERVGSDGDTGRRTHKGLPGDKAQKRARGGSKEAWFFFLFIM